MCFPSIGAFIMGCCLGIYTAWQLLMEARTKSHQDRTTQTADCNGCARLRGQLNELLKTQTKNAVQSKACEQRAELEAELERCMYFLRAAEAQETSRRAEIRSLETELRLARDGNSAEHEKILTVKREIEGLQQQNAQLMAANRCWAKKTIDERHRVQRAERDLDIWADKIKTLADDRRDLRRKLERAEADRRHHERRASGQRESRIRAEVENEELRRPRTGMRREMFT